MPPALIALAIQIFAVAAALLPALWLGWPMAGAVAGAAILACLLCLLARQPWWWRWIHVLFLPIVWLAVHWDLPPWVYLLAFLSIWLVFGQIAWGHRGRNRVPLFLSNRATLALLTRHLPASGRFIDLGAGTGTVLCHLARNPALHALALNGIEQAWLPCQIARWRIRCGRPRGSSAERSPPCVTRGDFWQHPLGPYDVVYAFLSPAAMPALWRKACAEMRAGSLLISNSFDIPDVSPDAIWQAEQAEERGARRLYVWRITPQEASPGFR